MKLNPTPVGEFLASSRTRVSPGARRTQTLKRESALGGGPFNAARTSGRGRPQRAATIRDPSRARTPVIDAPLSSKHHPRRQIPGEATEAPLGSSIHERSPVTTKGRSEFVSGLGGVFFEGLDRVERHFLEPEADELRRLGQDVVGHGDNRRAAGFGLKNVQHLAGAGPE